MKIWLNDHKIKETDRFIMCEACVFKREMNRHSIRCLARTFNLQGKESICIRGYQYEDNV